jgi:predicted enzyme related to lactoylglutathione lyase
MGNIGFFEVYVDDFQRAQKFYHDVFGWEFSISTVVPYEFYMIDTSTNPMGIKEGGMRKRAQPLPENSAPGYVCFIMVEAIDAALEKIVEHGGKVTVPKAYVPAGYFASALDTEGNAFSIWEVAP